MNQLWSVSLDCFIMLNKLVKYFLVLSVTIFIHSILIAQVDSVSIKNRFISLINNVEYIEVSVERKLKSVYETDTIFDKGHLIANYEFLPKSSFCYLSVYENTYDRYLIYDTSGFKYVVKDNFEIVKQLARPEPYDTLVKNSTGLGEPLFPYILDKTVNFTKCFFNRDSARIEKRDDSSTTFFADVVREGNIKALWRIKLSNKTGLPYFIIEQVTLADGETQYREFHFSYKLTQEQLRGHQLALLKTKDNNSIIKVREKEVNDKIFVSEQMHFDSLNVRDLDNNIISIKPLKDKFLLLDFSYIACKPCLESIPSLNKLHKEYANRLKIVTINPFDKKPNILNLNKKMGIKHLTVNIDYEKFSKLNIRGFPTFILIDNKGIVKLVLDGYGEGVYEKIEKLIKD
jgi:thiol-disulfide isomerase/thioredoxin